MASHLRLVNVIWLFQRFVFPLSEAELLPSGAGPLTDWRNQPETIHFTHAPRLITPMMHLFTHSALFLTRGRYAAKMKAMTEAERGQIALHTIWKKDVLCRETLFLMHSELECKQSHFIGQLFILHLFLSNITSDRGREVVFIYFLFDFCFIWLLSVPKSSVSV